MEVSDLIVNDGLRDELDFILRSEMRIKILFYLLNEDLTLSQLTERGLNYNSLYTNIKQLESRGFLLKRDDCYAVSNVGRKKVAYLRKLSNLANNLTALEDYLNSHLICDYDLDALASIPDNAHYEIFNKKNTDPYNVIHRFTSNMIKGTGNKCILTNIHQEYYEFNKRFDTSSELEILTEKKLMDYLLEDYALFSGERTGNVKVKPVNSINLSLVVNDEEMMLMLYNGDGSYDPTSAIVSNDTKLIDWAYKLFDEIALSSCEEWRKFL